jgi:SAM-dependent methyltransferase
MIGQKELKEYYNQDYYGTNKKHFRRVEDYEYFLDYLRPQGPGRLLDVSCGRGMLLKAAEVYYGCQTYGLDISDRAIHEAKKNTSSLSLLIANGEFLPYKNGTFDYVTCIGSVEHFISPQKGLEEMIRVCKDGGGMCLVLPNYYYLLNIINVFFHGDHLIGHHQINEKLDTLKGWYRFLRRNGLTGLNVYQDKGGSQPPLFESKSLVRIMRRLIKRILVSITPLSLTYQFVFICQKSERKNA